MKKHEGDRHRGNLSIIEASRDETSENSIALIIGGYAELKGRRFVAAIGICERVNTRKRDLCRAIGRKYVCSVARFQYSYILFMAV